MVLLSMQLSFWPIQLLYRLPVMTTQNYSLVFSRGRERGISFPLVPCQDYYKNGIKAVYELLQRATNGYLALKS